MKPSIHTSGGSWEATRTERKRRRARAGVNVRTLRTIRDGADKFEQVHRAAVRAALHQIDTDSAVSVVTGLSPERLADLGGMP